jgi:hypothetical protein
MSHGEAGNFQHALFSSGQSTCGKLALMPQPRHPVTSFVKRLLEGPRIPAKQPPAEAEVFLNRHPGENAVTLKEKGDPASQHLGWGQAPDGLAPVLHLAS